MTITRPTTAASTPTEPDPSPGSTPATAPPGPFSAKEALQQIAAVLALLTMVVLALADYALGEYFRALGPTPEGVGIDKQTLLIRACPVLALLAILVLPMGFSAGIAGRRAVPARIRRLLSTHPAVWGLGLAAGLGLVLVLPGSPDPFDSTLLVSGMLSGVLIFGPGAYHLLRKGLPVAFVCLIAAVVGCLTLGPYLGDRAYADGTALRTRGTVTMLSYLVGARPVAADASWTDLDEVHHRERIVYLGDQNGMSSFLSCAGREVERVPSTQVRLRFVAPEAVEGSLCAP
ncbi:hypothetical protein HUT16_08990 [Kitasatospora sp. NA04385]|uniref:hypothetical protein n=1 Tax=Kitasatospora sp. NA04385 TaxID=2742135 RepID=UPI0015914524|nr:hypothetical protein [Kitasatospora sp. NA04385]QKW19181.1 hypothetical protein HUT16_08990 [Kitasatospora sp. NA04385]